MKMEGAFRSSLLRIIFPHIPSSPKNPRSISPSNTVVAGPVIYTRFSSLSQEMFKSPPRSCTVTGDDAVCGLQDGREGHGCQTGIWHIIQKGLDKRASDLVFCKSKGQQTDEIGDNCHHQDIEIYIMTLERLPLSLPAGRNKPPGLLPEVL